MLHVYMKECQVTPERSSGFVKERGPVGILHCFWGVVCTKHHLRIKMGKSIRASGSSAFLQISSFCSFCGGNRIFKYSSQASGDFDFIGIPLKESMLPKGQGGGDIKATCLCGVWHDRRSSFLPVPFYSSRKDLGSVIMNWSVRRGCSSVAGRMLNMQRPWTQFSEPNTT